MQIGRKVEELLRFRVSLRRQTQRNQWICCFVSERCDEDGNLEIVGAPKGLGEEIAGFNNSWEMVRRVVQIIKENGTSSKMLLIVCAATFTLLFVSTMR
jgi:hypothetical protein